MTKRPRPDTYHASRHITPVPFHAVDQQLVTELWQEARYWKQEAKRLQDYIYEHYEERPQPKPEDMDNRQT